MTNTRKSGNRIKTRASRPFVLYHCKLDTCCNFFTKDTINGDPKYCDSHKDKHGELLDECWQYRENAKLHISDPVK